MYLDRAIVVDAETLAEGLRVNSVWGGRFWIRKEESDFIIVGFECLYEETKVEPVYGIYPCYKIRVGNSKRTSIVLDLKEATGGPENEHYFDCIAEYFKRMYEKNVSR